MRIQSLNQRDDAKKDDGSAVIELSGLELIALNNILSKVSKEAECRSIVQHSSLDKIDFHKMEELA